MSMKGWGRMSCYAKVAAAFIITVQVVLGQSVTGPRLHQWVQGIEGKTPDGRRQFIRDELKKMEVKYTTASFARDRHVGTKTERFEGENIIVSFGEGPKSVVIGAHLDAVEGSPGANDNGGGVAVVLGLIRALKDHNWKIRVTFCFFDQEEEGLIGSSEFVKSYGDSVDHVAMINLDVEGTGEEVYVGPVGGGDDDLILPYVRRAVKAVRATLRESQHYPPSDHLSFANKRLENISISIVPKGDVLLFEKAAKNGWNIDPKEMPKVMKVMHTPNDKSSLVSPRALETSYIVVSNILQLLNDAPSSR